MNRNIKASWCNCSVRTESPVSVLQAADNARKGMSQCPVHKFWRFDVNSYGKVTQSQFLHWQFQSGILSQVVSLRPKRSITR